MDKVEKVLQYYQQFTLDSTIIINFIHVAIIPQGDFPSTVHALRNLFQNILDELMANTNPDDVVRLTLSHPLLHNEIYIAFLKAKNLTVQLIMDKVEKVLQSYQQFTMNSTITINFIHVAIMPKGVCGKRSLP